ncbi:MAG: hypothetical protein D6675_14560 [Gemmatimonadetes bacterium]|nr:MAG: hypothetical protein D6675_14560 [Gemmatimonadota bacterium]
MTIIHFYVYHLLSVRNSVRFHRVIFLLISLIICQRVSAAEKAGLPPEKKLSQYVLRHWSMEEGLPSNNLTDVLQTHDGYLWITTFSGVTRFDGLNFTTFTKENTPGIHSNLFRCLTEDQNGTLWLGTENGGLIAYDQQTFQVISDSVGFIEHLFVDRTNNLWIGTRTGLWRYDHHRFYPINDHPFMQNIYISGITQDEQGAIWFSGHNQGIGRLVGDSLTVYTAETQKLPTNNIWGIFYSDQALWFSTDTELFQFDGTTYQRIPLPPTNVLNIHVDSYGTLWLASASGLWRKTQSATEWDRLGQLEGLADPFIKDFWFDTEGSLWLASYRGGLYQLSNGKFINYGADEGLHGNIVNSIVELSNGDLVAGTDEGFLNRIHNNRVVLYPLKTDLAGKRIRDLLVDHRQQLWIGTYGGLFQVDSLGREQRVTGLPNDQIRELYEDTQHRIWVGTRNGGVVQLENGRIQQIFNVETGLSSNFIMSIREDPQGKLWIGTSGGGLNVIHNGAIQRQYTKADGLVSDIVFHTYFEPDGTVWVAQNGGISRIKNGKVATLTTAEGLPNDNLFDILEDEHHNFWIPCNLGIIRVAKSKVNAVMDGHLPAVHCRVFDQQDGMRESECTPTSKVLPARTGTIWVPTLGGIAGFNPQNIPINKTPPKVYIREFWVNNQPYDITGNLSFSPRSRRIIVHYSALSLNTPRGIHFKYQLAGFDTTWVSPTTYREAIYTNLSPGKYTFRVTASNIDGVWNPEGEQLQFEIKPYFYQTFPFYLLCLVVSFLSIFGFVQWRTYRIKQQSLHLKKLVQQRTAELAAKNKELILEKEKVEQRTRELQSAVEKLQELIQEKDEIMGIVSHDLKNPLTVILGIAQLGKNQKSFNPQNVSHFFGVIEESGDRMYNLVLKILDAYRLESVQEELPLEPLDIRQPLCRTIDDYQDRAAQKQIKLEYDLPDEPVMVLGETNAALQIFDNLISNAIKYSPPERSIFITVKTTETMVSISIRDQGQGLTEEDLNQIFGKFARLSAKPTGGEHSTGLGLSIAKRLVNMMNGDIRVESGGKDKGAIFTIELPRPETSGMSQQ